MERPWTTKQQRVPNVIYQNRLSPLLVKSQRYGGRHPHLVFGSESSRYRESLEIVSRLETEQLLLPPYLQPPYLQLRSRRRKTNAPSQ